MSCCEAQLHGVSDEPAEGYFFLVSASVPGRQGLCSTSLCPREWSSCHREGTFWKTCPAMALA